MMPGWWRRLALALGVLCGLGCGVWPVDGAVAVQLTDDRGVVVHVRAPAQRVVALTPALTEAVCALGQCHRLVGVDRYSNWPASVRSLPDVGGGLDPNVEAVLALRPDVVLAAKSWRVLARLEALGLQVVALEPQTHADVRRLLHQVGVVLGLPAPVGQGVWQGIEEGMQAAAQSLPAQVSGTRVYFEVSSAPYAASEASFMGQTLARLGAQNVVPASLGTFPRLNPEFVVRANPDVIMVAERDASGLGLRPGWGALGALREARVCAFARDDFDVLVRPGPRLAQAAWLMADCLRQKAPR